MAHLQTLQKGSAKYPLERAVTKAFAVPQGNNYADQQGKLLLGAASDTSSHRAHAQPMGPIPKETVST